MSTHFPKPRANFRNLAYMAVSDAGMSIRKAREEYDGACIEFAGDVMVEKTHGALAYFETPKNPHWRYHAAAEIGGIIHDLWHDEPMPLAQFMEAIGATKVEYPAETHE